MGNDSRAEVTRCGRVKMNPTNDNALEILNLNQTRKIKHMLNFISFAHHSTSASRTRTPPDCLDPHHHGFVLVLVLHLYRDLFAQAFRAETQVLGKAQMCHCSIVRRHNVCLPVLGALRARNLHCVHPCHFHVLVPHRHQVFPLDRPVH